MGLSAFLSTQIIDTTTVGRSVMTATDAAAARTAIGAGTGTIGGTVGATDNRLVRSDGTGAATVQSTGITVDDSNNVSGVGTFSSGAITANGAVNFQNGSGVTYAGWTGSSRVFYAGGDAFAVRTSTGGTYLYNAGFLAVTNSTDASSATADTFLSRESAGVWRMGTTSTGSNAGLKCGAITASGDLNIGNNTMYVGGSGYFRFADLTSVRPGGNWGLLDVAPMDNNRAGTLRLYNNLHSLTNYERLELGQDVAGDAFIRTSAGGTGTRRGLTLDATTITASGALACGTVTSSALMCAGAYTVATLPSASANSGKFAQVTDSSVTTFGSTVSGGGSNRVPVFSNGTNWVVA